MLRRLAVLAVAVLLVGAAAAQTQNTVPWTLDETWRTRNGWGAIMSDADAAAERARMRASAGGAPVTRTVMNNMPRMLRTRMLWAGTVSLGALAIVGALDWFYQEAMRSTQTPLDAWYESGAGGDYPVISWVQPFTTQNNVAHNPTSESSTEVYAFVLAQASVVATVRYRLECVSGGWTMLPQAHHQGSVFASGPRIYGPTNCQQASAQGFQASGVAEVAAWFWSWVESLPLYVPPGPSVPLTTHLDQNPTSYNGLNRVMEDYFDHQGRQPGFPYTREQPWGPGAGLTLSPVPNVNQWYGNPYVDPSIDTDGDGWTDAQEDAAGTNPMDPNEYPTEDPFVDDEDQPLPDRDGDGIPDIYDPCPYQAANTCMQEPTLPEDIATETTLRDVRRGVAEIADLLRDQGEASPPSFGIWEHMPLTQQVWEQLAASLLDQANTMEALMNTRMPWAAGGGWVPPVTYGGSIPDCPNPNYQLLGTTQSMGLCDTPVHTFLATVGRAVVLAIVLVGFYLGTMRWFSTW